jgi:hypothetical protein
MAPINELVADWKTMRAAMAAQLDMLEKRKTPRNSNTIVRLKRCIKTLDAMIADEGVPAIEAVRVETSEEMPES